MADFFFKGPAGSAAGPAGPQGDRLRRRYGLPPEHLPGFVNGRQAAVQRQQVAGTAPPMPDLSYGEQCFIEYMARRICDCLVDGLINVQQTARLPSHISPPYQGVCFERHIGTGSDPAALGGHPDLPVVLPFVGAGGAFTLLVDYIPDQGNNAVVRSIGIDVDPPVARGAIELRATVNGRPVAPFDPAHGSVVANPDATWFGFPGTCEAPNRDICINLFPGDIFQLEARNSFGGGNVEIGACVTGWHYAPTMQTSDRTIRGTLVDQR